MSVKHSIQEPQLSPRTQDSNDFSFNRTQQGVTKDKSTYTCPLCCCSYEDTFSLQIHFRLNMHINQMKKLMTEENAREIHQNDQKEI